MEDATKPQTDREWLIRVSSQIGTLSENFDILAKKLVEIEENKIAAIDKRLLDIENLIQQGRGGWKLALALWAFITVAVGWLIKYLTK
jgi:hypothetical protein